MTSIETDTDSCIIRSPEIDNNRVTRPVNKTLNSSVEIPVGAGLS